MRVYPPTTSLVSSTDRCEQITIGALASWGDLQELVDRAESAAKEIGVTVRWTGTAIRQITLRAAGPNASVDAFENQLARIAASIDSRAPSLQSGARELPATADDGLEPAVGPGKRNDGFEPAVCPGKRNDGFELA